MSRFLSHCRIDRISITSVMSVICASAILWLRNCLTGHSVRRWFTSCHSSEPRWQSMSCLKYGDVRRSFVIRVLRFSFETGTAGTRVSWSCTDINGINMYDFVLFMYLHNVRIPAEECCLISWLPHLNSGHPVGQKLHHTRFFAVCYLVLSRNTRKGDEMHMISSHKANKRLNSTEITSDGSVQLVWCITYA